MMKYTFKAVEFIIIFKSEAIWLKTFGTFFESINIMFYMNLCLNGETI